MKVAQLCLTLCDPMDYTVHGIFQARVLERGAVAFSPIKLNASILNRHTHVTQMRLRKTATISSFPDLQSPLPMPKTLCLSNSLIAQLVKKPPAMQETPIRLLGREDPLERDSLPTPVFLGLPCGLAGEESACNAGDLGLISGLGISPGEWKGFPLQYSGLENSMDCIVHGITKNQT